MGGRAADLQARGLLDGDGLTAAGQATRDSVEVATDRLGAAPWLALGAADVGRVTELGRSLSQRAAAAGAFPSGVFAAGP